MLLFVEKNLTFMTEKYRKR